MQCLMYNKIIIEYTIYIRLRMSSSILFPTNEYTTSSKSSEQIQRLMMNEESLLDSLLYILNKGHPLQLPYAFRNFHLYPDKLLGIVCSKLSKQNAENQAIIAQSLKIMMKSQKKTDRPPNNKQKKELIVTERQRNQRHPSTHQETSLLLIKLEQIQLIFDTVLETLTNWSALNNQHLIDVIQIAIEIKPKVSITSDPNPNFDKTRQTFLKRLQETILTLGKPNQPIISKIVAGRLVPVFIKYTGHVIRGQMIDIIKRIISDSEFEAKKIWVEEILPKILQNLKLEYIQLHLQQKIYETIYDENEEIGCMALDVVLKNVSKFSVEQQSSRIVKLFIDSLTSKNEKIVMIVTGMMGEIYEKLQGIILKSQVHCLKFWKSLIEVAQFKNEKILNNFIYNLPGILYLSKKYHRVDAVCEIYTQLFYNPDADTLLLTSYFHEMAKMFPSKKKLLKQTAYSLLTEIFEQNQISDQSIKIIESIMKHLYESKQVFFRENQDAHQLQKSQTENDDGSSNYFDQTFNEYLQKYFAVCLNRKNGKYLINLYESIGKCYEYFSSAFIESTLLPKIYQAIRSKTSYLEVCIRLLVVFLTKQLTLINNYVSKINVELSKSTKSYERQAALIFLCYCYEYFSSDIFQQFKMGQKFLQFSNQKSIKNKLVFIKNCPNIIYYLTKEQKLEFNIILNKMKKDYCSQKKNDKYEVADEISWLIENTDFNQNQAQRAENMIRSKKIREKQKAKCNSNHPTQNQISFLSNKRMIGGRKGTADMTLKNLKKQDILKKRVEAKSKTKIMIKDVSKKRTPITSIRPNLPKKN